MPPVETVPFDCKLILWAPDYVGLVAPFGDKLNPVRWGDDHYFPRWGITPPVGWWTWLERGSKPRPADVQTWAEFEAGL